MNRRRPIIQRVPRLLPVLVSTFLGFALMTSGFASPPGKNGPKFTYLTWMSEDTSTTMTVNFHLPLDAKESSVYYDTEPRKGEISAYSNQEKGISIPLSFAQRSVHYAELRGLSPGATYYFAVGSTKYGFSEEMKFRTIPDDSRLRFVVGGDMGTDNIVGDLLHQASKTNPQFAILGGDLAYGNGRKNKWKKWDRWLKNWTSQMVTKDGFLIPLVAAIGNHEVQNLIGSEATAPFYFSYFAQHPGRAFFSRRFGQSVLLCILDSGFTSPIGGSQAAWLESTLRRNKTIPVKFAAYHVPMYPSHRSFHGHTSRTARSHWLPIFDRFSLTTAFEHHDHTLKRTKRLKDGQFHPEGTLYLGDGALGKKPRKVYGDRWYLEKSLSVRHFWSVEVDEQRVKYEAFDENGKLLDRYSLPIPAPSPKKSGSMPPIP